MRSSNQRDLVLKIIEESYNHLSVDEIYNLARKEMHNISLGTVYRNINQLLENNLIRKIKCDENIDRYDNVKIEHSHFVCNHCGKIIDVFNKYIEDVTYINNNKVENYELIFKGICKECEEKGNG